MDLDLVVVAAGVGSRFGGLKQLARVGPAGETLVDYSVFDALRAGVRRVVFVIRRETEAEFHALLGTRFAARVEVAYAFQELDDLPSGLAAPRERSKPWGTGHAVLAARGLVRAPFIVVNADDFYGPSAYRLAASFLRDAVPGPRDAWAMVAYRLAATLSEHGTVSRGVCEVGSGGGLVAIRERGGLEPCPGGAREAATGGGGPVLAADTPVSMNFWAFRPGLFARLAERFERFLRERGGDPAAEFFLPSAVQDLVSDGTATVAVLDCPDPWLGMTYREDRDRVAAGLRSLAAAGVYPDPLWA